MPGAPRKTPTAFQIEFYEKDGRKPVLEWIKEDLSPIKRRALGTAMRRVLQAHGVEVCRGSWGSKVHGDGVYEFRLRMKGKEVINLEAEVHGITEREARARFAGDLSEDILLRVFFHPYGDKLLLLLGGYDKGEDASAKRQQSEIRTAAARLHDFQTRRAAEKKRSARRGT